MRAPNLEDLTIIESASNLASHIEANKKSLILNLNNNNKSQFHGNHNIAKSGNGNDFWQFREHIEGEAANNIAWRKSAKSDKLIIKEFEAAKPFKLQFWSDYRPRMNWKSDTERQTKSDYALVFSLGLIKYFRTNQEAIGLLNQKSNAAQNPNNIDALRSAGSSYPHRFAQGTAILITDGLDNLEFLQTIFTIAKNAKCKIVLVIIKDENERNFNFEGSANFVQTTGDENGLLIQDCQTIAKQFRENYDNHFLTIKEMCEKMGFFYTEIKTNQAALPYALGIIKNLEMRKSASANL